VGHILDALLVAVATIKADTGLGVGMESPFGLGCLGPQFQSVLARGGELWVATSAVEAFFQRTNSSTSGVASGRRDDGGRGKKKNPASAGSKTIG